MVTSPPNAEYLYRHGLAPEDRERLPYYRNLLECLSASPLARQLLDEIPLDQRNPMLVLAALHFSALSGDALLSPLYREISNSDPRAFAMDVVSALETRPELVRNHLSRKTQTNEPGRSAVLAQLLRELAARGLSDVHLIDVGTSMGLNLFPDRYHVNADVANDPLSLELIDLWGGLVEGPLPVIHQRIGIDLSPLDPQNEEDVRWLEACLWPEEPIRTWRLRQILRDMNSWPEVERIRGSALEVIDAVLESCSKDGIPIIFHSWAAAYFNHDYQVAWREKMLRHTRERALWIYIEFPKSVGGLAPPDAPTPAPRSGASQIVVTESGREPASWGWSHSHGRWIALDCPR